MADDLAESRRISLDDWRHRPVTERAPELLGWIFERQHNGRRAAFAVATYNIHKCRGFDRRIVPGAYHSVIEELNADILCLQEVVNAPDGPPHLQPGPRDRKGLPDYAWCFGATALLRGGNYGNMTLTRFRIRAGGIST